MKALPIGLVVALGLVVGVFWTRDTAPVTERRAAPVMDKRIASHRPSAGIARSPSLRPTLPIKTLEPTATDPEIRPNQDALWRDLRGFADATKLTEAQWEHFQRDLSELAATERAAFTQGARTDLDGFIELTDELEAELLERCAAYMTHEQIMELRFRFLGLVSRVRRLHYVPE